MYLIICVCKHSTLGLNVIILPMLCYVTLRCGRLRYVTLRYVTLRYVTLRYVTLRYVTRRDATRRDATRRDATLRYVTSRYDMLHYATLQQKVATSSEWQKHVYYFVASDSSSVVVVGAVVHKTGFLLDNVVVQEVGLGHRSPSTDPRDPASSHVQPMHVHVTSMGSYTAVTAAWDVEDPESPVTGHSWAVGTVRGESCRRLCNTIAMLFLRNTIIVKATFRSAVCLNMKYV